MPTRKQRRRAKKERRHDYETVWVDEEGNELEEPPEDLVPAPRERNENGKPKAKAKTQPQRGGRQVRVPPKPSWQRAAKRSLIIGGALFAVIYVLGSKGGHSVAGALILALIYTAIFIPAQYTIDRFAYNRWQRREAQQGAKGPAKKR
jgi:hypothetical protein